MLPAPDSSDEARPALPLEWVDLIVADACSDARAMETLGREPTDEEWAALRAARAHRRAFEALSRLAVPAALDGLVVASLEAGHRQERAVELVASMGACPAPRDLDGLVGELVEGSASRVRTSPPSVLDRLVEERVEDPEGGMVRSMTGRLSRQAAPADLEERLREYSWFERTAAERQSAALRLAAAVAAAAVLLLTLRLVGGEGPEPASTATSSGSRFTIVHVDSLDRAGLSAADRILLGTLTGVAQ